MSGLYVCRSDFSLKMSELADKFRRARAYYVSEGTALDAMI